MGGIGASSWSIPGWALLAILAGLAVLVFLSIGGVIYAVTRAARGTRSQEDKHEGS